MLRNILAVVAGVVLASVVIYAVEMIGHAAFPSATVAGADCADPATWRDRAAALLCMAATPFGAKAAVVAGWLLGAAAGSAAALLVGLRWAPLAWVVAATVFLLCIMNFVAIPHPAWMMLGAVGATFGAAAIMIALLRASYAPPRPPHDPIPKM